MYFSSHGLIIELIVYLVKTIIKMKNNQGILNLIEKKINFKFKDEDFIMDLTKGDLDDNWNSFVTSDDVERDLNFHWEGYSENHKPNLIVYELRYNGDGTWSTDTYSGDETNIKLIKVIGTEGEYFGIPFDGAKALLFEVSDKDGNIILKSKSMNKAGDEAIIKKAVLTCIDVYGNRKEIGNYLNK